MADKNKYKRSSLTDFIRYRNNEMNGDERNAFERELQKDPFAEDAAEGFSRIHADKVNEDITTLNKRLQRKTDKRSRTSIYRIAAAIAVLMVVSTLLIVNLKEKQSLTLSENIRHEIKTPVTIPVPEPILLPSVAATDKKQVIPPPAPLKSKKEENLDNIQVADEQFAESQVSVLKDSEVTKTDLSKIAAGEVYDQVFISDKRMDMARVAGTPAISKSESGSEFQPPQPVIGRDSFDIYLEKNIRNSLTDNSGQKVVTISFNILIDSTINDIKIISSPGKAWSEEAIRLIREGPAWKPAMQYGKVIQERASVRIVFK